MEMYLRIRRQHYIICPRKIIAELQQGKHFGEEELWDRAKKWKVTLTAIEDVRFLDFSFHEELLTSIVKQLFEAFMIPKARA